MLAAIVDPAKGSQTWSEQASIPLVRELLRRHSDLPSYGMTHFQGTKAQKSNLWREYRNYIIQALSYFDAAINVPNRSACLLLYYAALNFAKAELLAANPSKIVGKRIGHGLSFSPTKARKVTSDALSVQEGAFRMLYEKRIGRQLPLGQRLPIQRLLRNIPEIATQLQDVQFDLCAALPLFQLIAVDASSAWPLLLTWSTVSPATSTGKLFYKVFQQVTVNATTWRDEFSLSRRAAGNPVIYQSIDVAANPAQGFFNTQGAQAITWRIKNILSPPVKAEADAFLTPSLYASELLPMPASLARYATIYYASSLVRYRPSIFDERSAPENAYLFDAIARECALPILVDALNELEGRTQIFYDSGSFRT